MVIIVATFGANQSTNATNKYGVAKISPNITDNYLYIRKDRN